VKPGAAKILPSYGLGSLSDVVPGVLRALGVPGASDPMGLAASLTGAASVAVLLLDGLGYHGLRLAAPYAPTLASIMSGALWGTTVRTITSGFPSTTPTSLTSLGTGAAPGPHGVLGFNVNVPGTDQVLTHIAWSDEPDPLRWQPLATQFTLAAAAGIATHVVSRPEYAGTGLTTAAFRGGRYFDAPDLHALADGILAGLAQRRSIVYGYHPDIDGAGHLFGLGSRQWLATVAAVDRMLTRLIDRLPLDAALVITADHGQINVPEDRRFDLDADRRLRDGVRLVAGEARVRYLHALPGATDDVVAAWRGVLGDAAWVVRREEAVAQGWFGPVPEEHLQRIGDVVAACHEDYVVLATRTDPEKVANMIGFHGSATEPEMRIPLLVIRHP
jgi:hypothetical protein